MAPAPSMERSGGESTAGDATTRSIPTPFLTKTYQLVDDKAINDVISWNEDGSSFIVWNPIEFAKDLLPKYFKHNNFSSFVRQLNTYGFKKVVSDRWEFSNDCFRRGEKRLLCDIQRRKMTSPSAVPPVAPAGTTVSSPVKRCKVVSPSNSGEEQVVSSNSNPNSSQGNTNKQRATYCDGTDEELIGENERLRRENVQLNKELSDIKQLCNSIYAMMSNYATNTYNSSSELTMVTPLDLMPLKRSSEPEDCVNPRLFGVPIGVKRPRGGEELQLKPPVVDVKSEPVDGGDYE